MCVEKENQVKRVKTQTNRKGTVHLFCVQIPVSPQCLSFLFVAVTKCPDKSSTQEEEDSDSGQVTVLFCRVTMAGAPDSWPHCIHSQAAESMNAYSVPLLLIVVFGLAQEPMPSPVDRQVFFFPPPRTQHNAPDIPEAHLSCDSRFC